MKYFGMSLAVAASMGSAAFAGGLERDAQSVGVLFENGRYLEVGLSFASPDVSGVGGAGSATPGADSGNILESYSGLSLAFKDDINDNLSYAIIFNQPYGADIAYPASTYFATNTTAELDANTLTGILQYNFDNNVSIYGGARVQSMDAEANVPFLAGYSLTGERDIGYGYLAGVAYEKPELALRVALTYHSEIKHEVTTTESLTPATPTVTNLDTPQSWSLEFQSGLNPRTLLFGSVRWVEWSAFQVAPPSFVGATGGPLASFADDRTTYSIGIGRGLNKQWSIFGALAYEDQTGSPTGNLSPTDGFMRYTVGATYRKDNMKITGGLSYVDIGDANSQLGAVNPAGIFTNNSAVGAGIKIGYSF